MGKDKKKAKNKWKKYFTYYNILLPSKEKKKTFRPILFVCILYILDKYVCI